MSSISWKFPRWRGGIIRRAGASSTSRGLAIKKIDPTNTNASQSRIPRSASRTPMSRSEPLSVAKKVPIWWSNSSLDMGLPMLSLSLHLTRSWSMLCLVSGHFWNCVCTGSARGSENPSTSPPAAAIKPSPITPAATPRGAGILRSSGLSAQATMVAASTPSITVLMAVKK